MDRACGILLPVSSLPSAYGIGTLGKNAYDFVDFLHSAGQSYWQILPLVPTNCGNSPYSSFSTFAGNPNYIDPDLLVKEGFLKRSELKGIDWGEDETQVDYEKVNTGRQRLLRLAYERGKEAFKPETEKFRRENPWVETYGLYMAAKEYFGMTGWFEWEDEGLRKHRCDAVEHYRRLLKSSVDYHIFVQTLFYTQWNALKSYANSRGIRFIGDMPIYVALDSADVWSEPEFFLLDENDRPTMVAGCPPDDFTADGQLWGNPLYNWDRMRADGFGWWIRRIGGAEKLYDVLRIDHFRGLDSYWAVPSGEKTAINGTWQPGPGTALTSVLSSWFCNMHFIAEDLGLMTDGVRSLVQKSGFPNMAVLQFAFDSASDSDYLPHNLKRNCICYVGTHDNDTVSGWVASRSKEDLKFAREYMHISEDEGWCWGMIRTGMASVCELFIVQMQDVLEKGPECRMNMPGVAEGNWRWRMKKGESDRKTAKKLHEYAARYRRLPR